MSHPEFIVCAAIKFEQKTPRQERNNQPGYEFIVPCVRHWDSIAHDIDNSRDNYYTYKEIAQGFLTNLERFVDRKEALQIAKANNQIRFKLDYEPDELYSEMLY